MLQVAKTADTQAKTINIAAEDYFKEPSEERLEELVLSGNKLIYYFIKLYGVGNSRDELYQVGVEGLLKAIKNYEPKQGNSFATYAGNCIIGEIRHFVRKEASFYKPRTIEIMQSKIDNLIDKAINDGVEIPSDCDIARSINLKEEGVHEVMRAGLVPLDALDLSRIATENYETFKLPVEDRILLENAMKKLSDIEKKVIKMLFVRDMTQQQVSDILGVNQRKVSRIKQSGIKILKDYMVDEES